VSVHPENAAPDRRIFCNRTLNLRSIRAIGYDMDYTLVHYDVNEWEGTAYHHMKERLSDVGFPVDELQFDSTLVARGLVIDKRLGNIVKANRFGYVKAAMHGTRMLGFREMRNSYARTLVDLNEDRWVFLNTLFSISEACMYAQLVDLLDEGVLDGAWKYSDLYDAVREALDAAHIEGSLKTAIMENPGRYVDRDPNTAASLLDQRYAGKKLVLITNSGWKYTRFMLRYALDEYLPGEMRWTDLFDIVVVSARKPLFFMSTHQPVYEVATDEGLLQPTVGGIETGKRYVGGHARMVEHCLGLDGEQILYVGDHIYGDVNVSKQICRWRTALVLRELERELQGIQAARDNQERIAEMMQKKQRMEYQMSDLRLHLQRVTSRYAEETGDADAIRAEMTALREELVELDSEIGPLVVADGKQVSDRWGYMLRAGNDKSHLTRQLERYADIYTSRVGNFLTYTPFNYFRSPRGSLPHDPGNP
jgi:HAD superfamily 5'-nucleotidase-like hydrolase